MNRLLQVAIAALLLACAADARAFERRWGLDVGILSGVSGVGGVPDAAPSAGVTLVLGYMIRDEMGLFVSGTALPMRTSHSDVDGSGWLTASEVGFRFIGHEGDSPWAFQTGGSFGVASVPLSVSGDARTLRCFLVSYTVGTERELSRDVSVGLALRGSLITIDSSRPVKDDVITGFIIGPTLYVRRSWGF
jgi:hypothetical protein